MVETTRRPSISFADSAIVSVMLFRPSGLFFCGPQLTYLWRMRQRQLNRVIRHLELSIGASEAGFIDTRHSLSQKLLGRRRPISVVEFLELGVCYGWRDWLLVWIPSRGCSLLVALVLFPCFSLGAYVSSWTVSGAINTFIFVAWENADSRPLAPFDGALFGVFLMRPSATFGRWTSSVNLC